MIHGHAICCYRSEAARKAVYRGLPMHLKKLGLAAVLLAVSTTVLAKQGEICSSKPVLKDGTLTNDTVFECKTAGSLTIPQLYAQGWRVISVLPQATMGTDPNTGLPQASFVWTVVVERD